MYGERDTACRQRQQRWWPVRDHNMNLKIRSAHFSSFLILLFASFFSITNLLVAEWIAGREPALSDLALVRLNERNEGWRDTEASVKDLQDVVQHKDGEPVPLLTGGVHLTSCTSLSPIHETTSL